MIPGNSTLPASKREVGRSAMLDFDLRVIRHKPSPFSIVIVFALFSAIRRDCYFSFIGSNLSRPCAITAPCAILTATNDAPKAQFSRLSIVSKFSK